MLLSIIVPILILFDETKSSAVQLLGASSACKIGEEVKNDCVRCVCTLNNLYRCTRSQCNDQYTIIEDSADRKTSKCRPNQVYVQDTTTCICGKDGQWPHRKCDAIFKTLSNASESCEPNSYVVIDCNVCRCDDKGIIDRKLCTKNDCEQQKSVRRNIQFNNVYGSCEPNNWYSLAPCQLCYCVDINKLVCNTGNNKNIMKLQLGSYNLTVCGKQLLKDALELVPDSQRTLREGNLQGETSLLPIHNQHNPKLSIPTRTTTHNYPQTQEYQPQMHDVEIQVNRESSETTDKAPENDKIEYYSEDSDETNETAPKKEVLRNARSTMLPYDEDEAERNDTEESNEVESKELEVETEQGYFEERQTSEIPKYLHQRFKQVRKPVANQLPTQMKQEPISQNNNENVLRLNLPNVFEKIFKMGLRKSMVKLDSAVKCVPGSTQKINCNLCFCLTNGKLLCTYKKC